MVSCAQTSCHADVVSQWQSPGRKGEHSRAFKHLGEDDGGRLATRIAANLGLRTSADKAPECLACHADFVPTDLRGKAFQISDGVSCEACHGGSRRWEAVHYARTEGAHADALAGGLYPTDDPEARAELCLSCHFGSSVEDQFVTHRIMGAGHPRLSFELDLFTSLQEHRAADAAYLARKASPYGAQVWAIGQAKAVALRMEALSDPRFAGTGLFPELVFFDCHACHRPIAEGNPTALGWSANPARRLGAGVPFLDDANLLMLSAAAAAIDGALAERLDAQALALHAASLRGRAAVEEAAGALRETAESLVRRFKGASFAEATVRAMLDEILAGARAREYTDYAGAQQAVMALDSLVRALGRDPDRDAGLRSVFDAAYDATSSAGAYSAASFRAALERIAASL